VRSGRIDAVSYDDVADALSLDHGSGDNILTKAFAVHACIVVVNGSAVYSRRRQQLTST